MDPRILKKPKPEPDPDEVGGSHGGAALPGGGQAGEEDDEELRREQEEALTALIDHRNKECEHIRQKLAYYRSQLEDAEMRLTEAQTKLERLRSAAHARVPVGVNASHTRTRPDPPQLQQPKMQKHLVIPSANLKIAAPTMTMRREAVATKGFGNLDKHLKQETDNRSISIERESLEPSNRVRMKRKLEHKQHQDLIPKIQSCSSPSIIRFQTGNHFPSQHKRKLRCLELCPVNDDLFATSALDGVINLWQVREKGSSVSLLSTSDCASSKRRWPEDLTWHPDGDRIFAAYSADGGDSQISIMDLNASQAEKVTLLQQKPHRKGIINSILFMPWVDVCFTTGGSDHAVVLWQQMNNSWNPKIIHGSIHSSAVMGVAGLHQKKIILSAGVDKRIVAFDLLAGRPEFKQLIDSRCMSVLPNPSDFNLFMVQTGSPNKQLRLYDLRLRRTEIHAFGWKQEASESQSALVNQAWSPDGLYISSGSADPRIHIFDIRHNGQTPSQSLRAHQKRVFKAVWHQSLPLLTSISSDLNIGLHRII